MSWYDVVRVRRKIDSRNKAELKLYATDGLRAVYQNNAGELIKLSDGVLTRAELVAEIRWRVFMKDKGYIILFITTVVAAIASVIAAFEGWK